METIFVALRVIVSLAVVLGLLWVLQRRLTRGRNGKEAGLVTVVGRQGIGQKASVVVVEVDGTRFVLGVTEQSVSVLHSDAMPAELGTAEAFARSLSAATGSAATGSVATGTVSAGTGATGTVAANTATPDAAGAVPPPLAFRPRRERNASKLGGSILSPTTWQQTAAALRQGR